MNRKISKKHSPRTRGGRRKRISTDATDFLSDLLGRTENWRRWHAKLTHVSVEGTRQAASLEKLDLF